MRSPSCEGNARVKRMNIVYYGKDVDTDILKEDIADMKRLIRELEKVYIAE